ncbi:transporter substrate-binding domain-containing protein [Carnobacterium jeotgali]|uniref:substrate-binding periplasmic protein n=1 Tax=Carnobacterium jeotgali TaxID=545534 RepID=UPI00388E34F4
MKKKKWMLAGIAAVALFVSACGTSTKEDANSSEGGDLLKSVQDAGVLKVGVMGTYQPYNFLNEDKEMDGFDVDIAKEIAKGLDVDVDFISQEFSGMIAGLQTGKFDMVASQMTITDDRKKEMLFSDPYITNQVKVIVTEDNDEITSVEDFPGKDIGVGLGTNDETYLRNELMTEVGEFNIRTYDDVITSLKDLDSGRIDATINNMYALKPIIEANGLKIKAVGEPIKSDQAGIAVTLGNEAFIEEVDKILADIKADGTYDEIFMKWFGEAPPQD